MVCNTSKLSCVPLCTHFDREYIYKKKSRNQNQFYSQLLLMAINFERFFFFFSFPICGKYGIVDKMFGTSYVKNYVWNGNLRFKNQESRVVFWWHLSRKVIRSQ